MTDAADAARRLAVLARSHGERDGYPHMVDLVALLPILDDVAAGRGDAGRAERWARGLVAAQGLDPDYRITDKHDALWTYSQGSARAAMALADAERVAERTADDAAVYTWVRGIYEATGGATPALREAYERYRAWEAETTKAPPG